MSGATPKTKTAEYWGGEIKWITPAELNSDSHYVCDTEKHLTVAGYKSASLHMMPRGTVLLTTRAPIGKVAIAIEEMCCNQGFKNLICSSVINNEYLFLYLKSRTAELQAMGRGATFKELSKKNVAGFEINLPAIDRQLDAVAKLTAIESQIERARALITHLDSLVKSQFVEMFGDICEGTSCYDMVPINALCTRIVGGGTPSMKHPEYYENGTIPWLKSGDVKARVVESGVLNITEVGLANSSARMVPEGSIIVVTRSGILKHSLPVAKAACPIAINQDLKALIPGDCILPDYLQWSLIVASPLLLSKVRATTADNIETSFLRSFRVPVPPTSLQRKFVKLVSQVDKSRFIAQQQIDKLQTLYDSLAQEYFS